MPWKRFYRLNIRQKVIVGLTVSMLTVGLIGATSYRYLHQIERKQDIVEIADDLTNIILEMRRYEKNYLLYGSDEDLKENQRYIQEGKKTLTSLDSEIRDLKGASSMDILEEELRLYAELMEKMGVAKSNAEKQALEDRLRITGKNLVDLSNHLAKFERDRILKIVKTLKTQLLSSIIIFGVLGAVLIPLVGQKIIRPLRVIEKTTNRIAQGNFTPVPVEDTHDETQRVMEAFNRMVVELEKRQEQLLQAEKLSSLGILTSGIAHQLNNPLNNISTSCQILLEEFDQGEPEFSRKMLTNVEQEVHRARDIVRGLLEFSRVKEFALAPTPLVEVVDRSITLISSQVPAGISVVRDVPADLVLRLDSQRLQQVFLNLIMNAIQAIGQNKGEIKVTAGPDPSSNRRALITVADTGAGIPEDVIGRIFDPFFTTKDVGSGTGLGLSIVYGIIQKHQGTISVESKKGEGARFLIRLPLPDAEENAAAAQKLLKA